TVPVMTSSRPTLRITRSAGSFPCPALIIRVRIAAVMTSSSPLIHAEGSTGASLASSPCGTGGTGRRWFWQDQGERHGNLRSAQDQDRSAPGQSAQDEFACADLFTDRCGCRVRRDLSHFFAHAGRAISSVPNGGGSVFMLSGSRPVLLAPGERV